MVPFLRVAACLAALVTFGASAQEPRHPRLLFSADDVPGMRNKARDAATAATYESLIARAEAALRAAPIVPSVTKRGEPDPPGETKGIAAARALQGRVLTLAMAFTLTGERRYRDGAVALLADAIANWRIWVDTAHAPPYDLMTGENALTFGLAYDWLYDALSDTERQRLREGAERRALQPYLDAVVRETPMSWHTARHNWNTVCNGGATVLALALGAESKLTPHVLERSVPAMEVYWQQLGDDGGWDEGTGYWSYGHRYGLIAAEALRRSGHEAGAAVFARPGVRQTGYFPFVFNPGRDLSASFGDSNRRANDPILYLLGREYSNPDFVWFQDRAPLLALTRDGWPQEALALVWRPIGEGWLPERQPAFTPKVDPVYAFNSIGWGMMATSQPDPAAFLAFKNGSLAANHTHLDLNHVTVGVGDRLVLRELGSRPYPADYFGPQRYGYYEISTAGHNTVLIGGRGQVHRRQGRLGWSVDGPGFSTFIGIADGTYEVAAPRVRRHIVFVDRRYWVVLDDIATAEPQPVELRFHTEGTFTRTDDVRWRAADGGHSVDVLLATPQPMTARVSSPEGWIRPLRLLAFTTPAPSRTHTIATVLVPRLPGVTGPERASAALVADTLDVRAGADRIVFTRSDGAWGVQSVNVAAAAPAAR